MFRVFVGIIIQLKCRIVKSFGGFSLWDYICFAKKTDCLEKFWKSSKIFENALDKTDLLWYNNYVVKQQRLNIMWRSRVVGRARATGNRVTTKNSSRVRISPSPPKIDKRVLVDFFIQTFRFDLLV